MLSRLTACRVLDSWQVLFPGTGYYAYAPTLSEALARLNARLADPTWEPWPEMMEGF
jgi:hypothetical protein